MQARRNHQHHPKFESTIQNTSWQARRASTPPGRLLGVVPWRVCGAVGARCVVTELLQPARTVPERGRNVSRASRSRQYRESKCTPCLLPSFSALRLSFTHPMLIGCLHMHVQSTSLSGKQSSRTREWDSLTQYACPRAELEPWAYYASAGDLCRSSKP